MTWSVFAVAAAVFGVSTLAPFAFRPLLRRLGVVDVPNKRSSHSRPTLRAGGLAPLIGWIVGIVLSMTLLPIDALPLGIAGVTALALALLGLADDLWSLAAAPRLGMQLGIGIGAALVGVSVTGAAAWWFAPFGVLLVVGYVNTANFMDGINGLSGLHGAVVGIALAIAGAVAETSWLVCAGAVIAAAFAAFLPWNLRGPGFFLGDVGSYLLGGSIAVTAMLAVGTGVPSFLVLSPLAVYVADTMVTMARRLVRGERIMSAHRSHVYQRMTDSGLSHLASASVVTVFAAANAVIGVVVWTTGAPVWVGLLALAALCALYLALPSLVRRGPDTRGVSAAARREDHAAVRASTLRPGVVAVFGATGFVGSAVVAELRGDGLDVVPLRTPRLVCDGDVSDGEALSALAAEHPQTDVLSEALRGVDVVVNSAGAAAPDSGEDPQLYGANSLLPAVIAHASARAGVRRVIHLSSAAVQGRRRTLDETAEVAPFSPYSSSKARGEAALLALRETSDRPSIVIVRATSVQGPGRLVTARLQSLARSRIASVAAPGDQPSAVSSVGELARLVRLLAEWRGETPAIVLQPWEGLSVRDVLRIAGGREPRVLPSVLCRFVLVGGFAVGRVVPRLLGVCRRLEMLWFGQQQVPGWASERMTATHGNDGVRDVLAHKAIAEVR